MGLTKDEVLATGKPRYVGWSDVPDGLKTKTQWSDEGMRLLRDVEPAAFAYGGSQHSRNAHYALFSRKQVEPKRRQRPGNPLPPTAENLATALFEINKAAKRRRDAAASAYARRKHNLATRRKEEKEAFYDLKDRVLRELVHGGVATLVGVHSKVDIRNHREWIDENDGAPCQDAVDDEGPRVVETEGRWETVPERCTTCMVCYEVAGFRFHKPIDAPPDGADAEVKDLGEWMSKATPRPLKMTLKDAEATLRAYLDARPSRCSAQDDARLISEANKIDFGLAP